MMIQAMNLSLIMNGLVKVAQDLTQLRIDSEHPQHREVAGSEIDLTKVDKEYEDDDSDEDFNDADEEVNKNKVSWKQWRMMISFDMNRHWMSVAHSFS